MADAGLTPPKATTKTSPMMGKVFDPDKADAYVDSFAIKGLEMGASLSLRAGAVSAGILVLFLLAWQLAVGGKAPVQQLDPEYAKLMGATATQGKSAIAEPPRGGREALAAHEDAILRPRPQ